MCVVIDSCCIAMVFDGSNSNHARFSPVLNWIKTRGCMVYGGTKYNAELGKLTKYLPLIAELKRAARAVYIDDLIVDPIAQSLKVSFPEPEFDDEHLVALVIASRCGVVATIDVVAISYLRRTDVFNGRGVKRPSIYRGHKSNATLCCDHRVVGACRD
jgi:hypothetical protein